MLLTACGSGGGGGGAGTGRPLDPGQCRPHPGRRPATPEGVPLNAEGPACAGPFRVRYAFNEERGHAIFSKCWRRRGATLKSVSLRMPPVPERECTCRDHATRDVRNAWSWSVSGDRATSGHAGCRCRPGRDAMRRYGARREVRHRCHRQNRRHPWPYARRCGTVADQFRRRGRHGAGPMPQWRLPPDG